MDNQYYTLRTLSAIALENTNPVQYLCKPREMILHSTFDWELIHKHLLLLAESGLVSISQADTIQFSITQNGLDMIANNGEPEINEIQLTVKGTVVQ